MTVAELIRALRKLDQSAEVFTRDDTEEEDGEPAAPINGEAWLGTIERVEVDSDGFVILCCNTCEDDDDDSDDEEDDADASDSDEEEDDACD